ncbi:hypothetical protein KAR91_76360, partial [Candidatus Pacearchaeota archaeon]|nr:hypothetical protein [Candidatus Pacearchaeota archaeon]
MNREGLTCLFVSLFLMFAIPIPQERRVSIPKPPNAWDIETLDGQRFKWKPPELPVKTKLSEELEYHRIEKICSPFFLKGALCLRPDLENYTEEDFKAVIDYIAEHDLANVIRVLLIMNFGWELNAAEILMPHPIIDGLYDLHTINPVWEAQVFRRLDYMVERRITVRLIINDGSGLRAWHSHYLDGDNNRGWDGRPTYRDRYGWTHWVHLSDPTYGTPDERARYKATRDYLLTFYNWLFPKLEKYKPYIIVENNEIEAYATWHNMFADLCNEYGYTRKYMITSTMANDYMSKPGIYDRWIPEFHGINSVAKYEDIRQWVPAGWSLIPSADGFGEKWIDMGKDEAARVLRKSLADGNLGFQGNSEGVWDNMNPKIYEIGATM